MNRISTIALLVLLTACSPAAPAQPAVRDSAHDLSGSGTGDSASVELTGGDYAIELTVMPDSDVGCYVGGALVGPSGQTQIGSINANSHAQQAETAFAHGLAAGSYYLKMYAGCPWSAVIRPA